MSLTCRGKSLMTSSSNHMSKKEKPPTLPSQPIVSAGWRGQQWPLPWWISHGTQSWRRKPTKSYSRRDLEVAEQRGIWHLWGVLWSPGPGFVPWESYSLCCSDTDKGDPYAEVILMLIFMVCLSMTPPLPSQGTCCGPCMNCSWFNYELFKPFSLGLESGENGWHVKAGNLCVTEVLSAFLLDTSACWLMSDTCISKHRTETDGKINYVTFSPGKL